MLLGSDALRDIMRWHRWRELLALVQPAVVVRPPDDHASVTRFLKEFGATQGFADAPTWLLSLPPVELASTEIRRAIAAGMRPAGIAEDAWREISARGLYGFGEARERIYTL
jgi:nicotinic acid mononucleotide adenylyltransferase